MKFLTEIFKKPFRYVYLKELYTNPKTLVDIEFYNRGKEIKELWVEPTCEDIRLDPETEYKITTHDKTIRFEYDVDGRMIMYLQQSFGLSYIKEHTVKKYRIQRIGV